MNKLCRKKKFCVENAKAPNGLLNENMQSVCIVVAQGGEGDPSVVIVLEKEVDISLFIQDVQSAMERDMNIISFVYSFNLLKI